MIARIMVALLLVTLPTITRAHDWYDSGCCSGHDCHPISSCDDLVELKDGTYKYLPTGDVFHRVLPSQDKKCHVCVGITPTEEGGQVRTPRCVYILQGT